MNNLERKYYSSLYADNPDAWVVISAEVPGTKKFLAGRSTLARNVATAIEEEALKADNNLFVTFHSFRKAPREGRGAAADVAFVSAVFLDVDLGETGIYADQKNPAQSVAAIKGVLTSWGLPPASAITSSGHGLHFEWRLDRTFEILTDAERVRAASFLKNFNGFAIQRAAKLGWKIDPMGDLPRVKRAVGSTNWKRADEPRPVTVLELDQACLYSMEVLEAFRPDRTDQPAKPVARSSNSNSDGELPDFQAAKAGCDFLQHVVADAATLSEPEWYAAISISARSEDGVAVTHAISKPHPDYTERGVDAKIAHALTASGPRTCADIHSGSPAFAGCEQCPFWGKITSPIQLGREAAQLVELMHDNAYDLGSTRFFEIENVSPWNEHAFRMAHLHKVANPVNDFAKSPFALKVDRVDYLPGMPRITREGGRPILNNYAAPTLQPIDGDCRNILAHFDYLIPDVTDREHALNYFASLVQQPGVKIDSALLIFGPQGTGKNLALDWVRSIVGERNTVVAPSNLIGSRWQGGNGNTLLLAFNEVMGVKREAANSLKEWITEERVTTEAKGIDPFSVRTPRGVVLFSNHHDALALETGDRRFAVIETTRTPKEKEYYKTLVAEASSELSAFSHFLGVRDLSNFSAKGPAPVSSAKRTMISLGRTPLEAAIEEAKESLDGVFRRDFGTAEEVIQTIKARGWDFRQPSTTSVGAVLASLDAEGLPQLRVPGYGRFRFWVWRNRPKWMRASNEKVTSEYIESQNPAVKWAGNLDIAC